MAATESVSTGEGNNVLVIETHAVENVPQVAMGLGSIGKTAVRSASGDIAVGATRSVRDNRALHLLDGANTAEDPEIGVGDPGELGCAIGSALEP